MCSSRWKNTFSTEIENENQGNSFIHSNTLADLKRSLSECVRAAQQKVLLDGQVVAKAALLLFQPFFYKQRTRQTNGAQTAKRFSFNRAVFQCAAASDWLSVSGGVQCARVMRLRHRHDESAARLIAVSAAAAAAAADK